MSSNTIDQLSRSVRGALKERFPGITPDTAAVRTVATEIVDTYQRNAHHNGNPLLDNPERLLHRIVEDITAYGPLTPLLNNPAIEEIEIDGSNIFVRDNETGTYTHANVDASESELHRIIIRLLEGTPVELNNENPIAKASVLDGSFRLTALIPPASLMLSATLRRHMRHHQSLRNLVHGDALSVEAAGFCWAIMQQSSTRYVICGVPGAGKTTLLAAMHRAVPRHHTIRFIDEVPEIVLDRARSSNYQTVPGGDGGKDVTMRDLIQAALKMRPARMVIGEVSGPESFELFQVANLGIGFAVTVHSNSALDGLYALADNATKAGINITISSAVRSFGTHLDFAFHLGFDQRDVNKPVRQVTEILAVDTRDGEFVTTPLFTRERLGAPLTWTGNRLDNDIEELIDLALPPDLGILPILTGAARPTLP